MSQCKGQKNGTDINWRVAEDGSVYSPFDTRVAIIDPEGTLYLYDKKVRTGLPFTPTDRCALTHRLRQLKEDNPSSDKSDSDPKPADPAEA